MPFISNEERPRLIQNASVACKPGHIAFLIYKEMKARWKASPGWTTADAIHQDFVMNPDDCTYIESLYSQMIGMDLLDIMNAASLSWQVFFQLVVMPYEICKRRENGDIE